MNDNINILYSSLQKEGFEDIGTEEQFRNYVKKPENVGILYNALAKEGYEDIGSADEFSKWLTSVPEVPGKDKTDEQGKQIDYVNQSSQNLPPIALREEAVSPLKDQSEYVNPWTNSPDYNFESLRKKGKIETVKRDDEGWLREAVAEKRSSVLPELGQVIEDVEESKRKYRQEHPLLSALSGFRGSMAPSIEGIHINDPKFRNLSAASQLLSESEKLLTRHKGGSAIEKAKSVIEGAKDSASDLDTYSMGLTEMLDNSSVLSAITKFEKGEELSPDEQHLLDAVAINMSAQAVAGDPGLGHMAGSAFVESIPFMVEMMMNPISGAGEGLGKAMTKYALKRFGKKAGSKIAEKAATIAGRVAGDAMASTGMSATSGIVGIAADATARMTGTPLYTDDFGEVSFGEVARDITGKIVLDDNGKPVPVGSVGKDNTGKALYKAFTSRTIENFSEMFGEYFGMAGKTLMNTKLGKKVSSSALMRAMDEFTTADWTKQFNQILKDGKYNGFISETAEEYVGGLLDAAFVGDQSFSDLASTDNLVQTVAAVGLMSGIFGSVNLAGIRLIRYKARKDLEKSEKKAYDLLGEDFDALRDNLSSLNLDAQEDAIKSVLASPDLDRSQKEAVIDYFHKQSYYNGLKFGENKRIEEAVQAETEAVHAESNPSTGMYVAASRIDPLSGERIPGTIVQESMGKDRVDWRGADGKVEMILKTEIDPSTVRSEPVQDVMDASIEAVRESEQAKIDHDTKYSPDIPEPQLESTFTINGKKYMFTQPTPEGWFLSQEVKEDGSLGAVTDEFDETAYFDAKQAEIDAMEALREQEASVLESQGQNEQAEIDSTADGDEYSRFVDTGEVSDERINDIANKIIRGESLSPEEESMRAGAAQRIEDKLKEASNTTNTSQVEAENAIVSAGEESNVSQNTTALEKSPMDVPEQNMPTTIPVDKDGNLLYHLAPVDVTLADILDGTLDSNEIDAFVDENKKAAGALLKRVNEKPPKMSTNKAKYLAQKKAWSDRVAEAEQQVTYWNEVESVLKESRMKPGDKASDEIKSMGEPLTGEELAAMMLADGSIKLTKESYKRETGAGEEEAKKMFGLFASGKNGGVNIERAGELVMLADLENGTHHFDQEDPNAGRNAIIEVLSSARTRGDLIDYVKNNRAAMAERERQAEYNAYAEWCEEMFHMSPEDYEAYEEHVMKDIVTRNLDEASYNELMSIFATQQNTNENEKQQNVEQSGTGGIREGGREILPGEESISAERVRGTEEGSSAADGDLNSEDGTAYEGKSGEEGALSGVQESVVDEVKPIGVGSFGPIYDQFRGKVKEAFDFLLNRKEGDLLGVFHRDDVGDIDLVWGDAQKNQGIAHILDKHVERQNDFQSVEEAINVIEDVIMNGAIQKEGKNRIELVGGNYKVVIRKDFDGISKNWIVTAFDYERGITEKTSSTITRSTPDSNEGGRAVASDEVSGIKDSYISSENQTEEEKAFVSPERKEGENLLDYAERIVEAKKLYNEERKVDISPTEAQKEAGNYKKGHIKINGFDVTIEQPAGSVRSGKDTNGKEWSVTMNNTYGYIRGTEGVDGDHIDVFLGSDMNSDMVYVVDQVNADRSFDEHKVMMGFPSLDDARSAYLSNYEEGWQGLGNITGVTLDEFKEWITSSTRKTKPFVEYKSITTSVVKKGYTIEKRHHEKKNKDIYAVNFDKRYSRDEFLKIKAEAKAHGGYYSSFGKKGYIFDKFENAERFAESVSGMKQAEKTVTFEAPIIEKGENILEYASRVAEKKTSFDNKDYKVGDKVLYKGDPATITDFENDGRPILDTGSAPVLYEYEIANWNDIQNLSEKNISLKAWSGMSAEERIAEAEKIPLSEDEITNAPTDEVNKANAIDYLRGNHGFIQSISYLKVYEDVRNSNRNTATDSSSTNTSQLDEAGNRNGDGLGTGREGRKSPEPVDRRNGSEDVSWQRIDGPDRERSLFDNIGEGGDSNLPSSEQPVDAVSSGSTESGRGSDAGSTGSDGGQRRRKTGPNHATADGRRGTDARRSPDAKTSTEKTEVDAEIDAALREFNDILSEFKQAGKETLNLSFAGMNSRQMEILPRLISAGAKVGHAYIKKGIYSFGEWMKQMREAFGDNLHAAGLSNVEVDAFITEMWKSKLPMNGEIHTLEEWASILGKANLRKKISNTLDEKRRAQHAAENVKVKVCDRENIAETLPFLLPQQQDDVLKAETQFFDESHNDREHAFGKGYMFTNGTGTGKTYTGLGIVKRFIKQGKGRILILTPSQTKVSDWIKDAANLDIELNDLDAVAKAKKDGTTATTEKGEGAVITTYANFRQNQALLEDDFDLIVYDESHRLLENKGGIGAIGAKQHYKISNRNENYAFLRLQDINPDWKTLKAKEEEFNDKRTAIIARLQKETSVTSELAFEQRGELPPVFNGSWNESAERMFPEIANLRKKIIELYAKYNKEVKPELERQAKEKVKRTKTVFLSATPFNTRENLDYVEGYIYTYPESEKQDGYSVQSPRSQFYLEHFGAGYKWRYHRLENSTSNPEAVSKQEIKFSDYLQHTLRTMSGRIIDSSYDYSRDFPTVTMEKAEEFNNAMEELAHESATGHAFYTVMGDYNYTSALFESMKVAQIIPRLKEHLARGRKVVIFHRRMESKNPIIPPFSAIFTQAEKDLNDIYDASERDKKRHKISALRKKYAGMLEWEQDLDLRMPREQLADVFGKNNVLFFSGKESKKIKEKAVDDFNNDDSGKNIIVIQEASGKEGISLHDVTGKHQRVLITLALPQSPITALQIEGRIYRIGNKSNAIFEYPLLGLNTELMLFGQKFNQQVSTTENLALGSQARNLRESFSRGVEEHSGNVDIDNQGVGGKIFDAPNPVEENSFDNAVLDYYTNQKLTGKRDNREGIDFYPTPEPLGFMLNQWGCISEGESVLEPSAGHGAIARYVPRENPLTAVEPSQRLFSKLQIKAGGNGRKFENTIFENYNVVNKHDVVLMNPPFGTGGKLAVDHVAKAFEHLEEGGRIVAIIPRGSTDKKFNKWYDEQKNAVLTAEIGLPNITFERAGTNVSCRIVVIDKVTNENLRSQAASNAVNVDLSTIKYDKIEDFFEDVRDISVPERTIDQKAKLRKKAAPVARELRTVKGVRDVSLTDEKIYVSGRGVWASIEWGDKKGDALTSYLSEEYKRFLNNYDYAVKEENESREVVYGEMKALACKLAGMTEDEMQRYISRKNDDIRYRFNGEKEAVNLDKEVNQKFNDELQRYQNGEMGNNEMFHLGNPEGAMKLFLPNLPIVMRQRIITKGSVKKHNVAPESLLNMPKSLSEPIFIFKREDNALGVLTEMKDRDGKNVCVAIALNKMIQDGKETLEVNDIRSIHGRSEADVIFPIVQNGTLRWVDKQKGLDWLSSASRYVQQEIGDQDLSSATKIIKSFVNPTVEEGKIIAEIDDLSNKLHTPVTIITDVNEIVDDSEKTQFRKRGSKGWYDPKTQEIVVVLPNNTSVADAQRTFLHEVVAHNGLRKLFGNDFDTFLSSVYANANEEIRREILRRTEGNPLRLHEATEEYLADLAEQGFNSMEERSLWNRIKDSFIAMLRKVGVDLGFKLSDNDLRYILWRSYRNLEEGNLLSKAEDISMKNKLGIGDYEVRFRAGENEDGIAKEYEEALRKRNKLRINTYKVREAFQDSMLSVKIFQDILEKHSGKKIRSFENVYKHENQLSSYNMANWRDFEKKYYEPLTKALDKLIDDKDTTYDDLLDYIYAKSGLKRNEQYPVLKANRDLDEFKKEVEDKLRKGELTEKQYNKLIENAEKKRDQYIEEAAGKDFSGLTGLMEEYNIRKEGDHTDFKLLAEQIVSNFEERHNTEALWRAIKDYNDAILKKEHDTGLISTERFNSLKEHGYDYYLPLRGWEEEVASDFYEYMKQISPIQNIDKEMGGRTSKAFDPLATMRSMAQTAIVLGNRNRMKQKLYNLVINRPSSLASVRDVWYVKNAKGEWEASFPDFSEVDSSVDMNKAIVDHESEMQALEKEGNAVRKSEKVNIGLRASKSQLNEHVVRVKINGREYAIYVNADPRAAQALNGLLSNEKNKVLGLLPGYNKMKRLYGAGLTSYNPDFIVANTVRDTHQATLLTFMKSGFHGVTTAIGNSPVVIKAVYRGIKGEFDPHNKYDVWFKEFLENGGETGYSQMLSLKDFRKDIRKRYSSSKIRRVGNKLIAPVSYFGKWVENANRMAEDVTRFNAYALARKSGKSIVDSVDDAKNISVNFNRRGAGYATSGFWGTLAGALNEFKLFFNPIIQGIDILLQPSKEHTARFITTLLSQFSLGLLVAFLNDLIDGDDDYWNQSDYNRMNNLMLKLPGTDNFVKIPLAPFFRELYGLGDVVYRMLTGRMSTNDAAWDTVSQVFRMFSLDGIADPKMLLTPDLFSPLIDIKVNENFMGMPIAKQTLFNELDPEYKRVYKGTNRLLVSASRFFNDITGGDDISKSNLDREWLNPAYIEHLLSNYTGGIGKTLSNIVGGFVDLYNKDIDNFTFRKIPVFGRYISDSDERIERSAVNRAYRTIEEDLKKMQHDEKGYAAAVARGDGMEFLEKLTGLQNSEEYKSFAKVEDILHSVQILEQYRKELENEDEVKNIDDKIIELKKMAIELMEAKKE